MTKRDPLPAQPRLAQPRRWTSLALTGATLGLTAASPLFAGGITLPHLPAPQSLPLTLVQEAEGEGGEAAAPQKAEGEGGEAAASEGGEGGEAGATQSLPDDVAYLTELSLVEGHLRAAALLYAKGLAEDAIALSYHPEAEMMDEVRDHLAEHGAADITPAMTAFSQAMEQGADQATVDARLADVQAAIAAGAAVEADELATRFAALTALAKAAAEEYEGSLENGAVKDVMAWHEAWAFLQIARAEAAALATLPDAKASAAAARILTALDGADPAFGDVMAATPLAGDSGILLAVAGRIELAASQVH